jgi:GxxExxY protein
MSTNQDPQTYEIIGAAMEVHRELGCGFSEPVYYEPFEFELSARGVPFRSGVELPIIYKGHRLRKRYRVDYDCYDAVVVEVKALSMIGTVEEAQLINYMRAANKDRGLLLNFGCRSLQYKRRVWRYAAAGTLASSSSSLQVCSGRRDAARSTRRCEESGARVRATRA